MNTFRKEERLCSAEAIRGCMNAGNSFGVSMLGVSYKLIGEGTYDYIFFKEGVFAKLMFSAPKKQNKRAVDRNFKKRHLRESYRKNKHSFLCFLREKNIRLHIVFIYRGDKQLSYREVEEAIIKALKEIQRRMEKKINGKNVE